MYYNGCRVYSLAYADHVHLTPKFSCKHTTTIAAKPHPKSACQLQRSLDRSLAGEGTVGTSPVFDPMADDGDEQSQKEPRRGENAQRPRLKTRYRAWCEDSRNPTPHDPHLLSASHLSVTLTIVSKHSEEQQQKVDEGEYSRPNKRRRDGDSSRVIAAVLQSEPAMINGANHQHESECHKHDMN